MTNIYIYKSGYNEALWSTGPTDADFTLTKNTASLDIDGSGALTAQGSFVSGPFNVDLYDSISTIWSYGADTNGNFSYATFGIARSGDKRYDQYDYSVQHALGTNGTSTDTIDLTSLSGEYYVYLSVYTNGKPGHVYSEAAEVYFSGNIPYGSGNSTFDDMLCGGNITLDSAYGSGNMTLGPCSVESIGGTNANFAYLNSTYLDNTTYDIEGSLTILGSVSGQLSGINTNLQGTNINNAGGLTNLNSPFSLSISSSGANYSTLASFLNATLSDMSVLSSGTTSGVSRYSVEWKKFSGRACITLDKEYVASTTTPTGDCFSMLKPLALSLKNDYGPLYYNECSCSINVPIYLNRPAHQDIQLSIATSQPSINIDYSGNAVIPAVTATDYVHHTGLYTIPSGSSYVNFPVTLIDNDSPALNYFNVNVLYAKTRNICQDSTYTINIILGTG